MSIFTPGIGRPAGSFTVQMTRQGSPFGSEEMFSPDFMVGGSWVWKGPRTVPSVVFGGLGWSMASTRRERPRMSERRINSYRVVICGFFPSLGLMDWKAIELTCRTSLLICPTLTRKSNAAIHSLVLRRTSRAKSCRCVTSRDITYLRRSSGPWELMTMVFSVMLSILRSFIGGILTFEGSMIAIFEEI
jgi:hypothetical protein